VVGVFPAGHASGGVADQVTDGAVRAGEANAVSGDKASVVAVDGSLYDGVATQEPELAP